MVGVGMEEKGGLGEEIGKALFFSTWVRRNSGKASPFPDIQASGQPELQMKGPSFPRHSSLWGSWGQEGPTRPLQASPQPVSTQVNQAWVLQSEKNLKPTGHRTPNLLTIVPADPLF